VKSKSINSKGNGRKWLSYRSCSTGYHFVSSTATGARAGSTADVCVRQGSRSMVPAPF